MPPLFGQPRYVAIEGPIRVGKSTLARILAERMGAERITEPDDNPFLADFYAGRAGAAFRAQMYFLARRFEQLRPLGSGRAAQPVVADYIFEKDRLFANINLTDDELAVYNRYYDLFRPQLGGPELVIYLTAPAPVLRERLARKNRAEERDLSDEYLEEVIQAYGHFFARYSQSDLLVVDTSEIDFVHRNADLRELLRRLEEPVEGRQYFLPLS